MYVYNDGCEQMQFWAPRHRVIYFGYLWICNICKNDDLFSGHAQGFAISTIKLNTKQNMRIQSTFAFDYGRKRRRGNTYIRIICIFCFCPLRIHWVYLCGLLAARQIWLIVSQVERNYCCCTTNDLITLILRLTIDEVIVYICDGIQCLTNDNQFN